MATETAWGDSWGDAWADSWGVYSAADDGGLAWLVYLRRQEKRPKKIELKRPINKLPVQVLLAALED